jgi:tRNA modification GTPase
VEKASYLDTVPIFALATPLSQSALALIRVSGPASIELLARLFSRPDALIAATSGQAQHGFLHVLGAEGEKLDEVVILPWKRPHGFTGEDGAEIMAHGSLAVLEVIQSELRRAGFRNALPGEFSFRAFMNGKIDLTRAEATSELISAKADKGRRDALTRLSGALERRIRGAREFLLGLMAEVNVQLDYAEDDDVPSRPLPLERLASLLSEVKLLSESFESGRIRSEGATVVLAGKTNAGKSSLFNLLLREDRAIVSETHGTTRDYLEAWVKIDGVPVALYDTAGLRDTADSVERVGIQRSRELLASADIILYLVDAAGAGSSDEDAERIQEDSRLAAKTLWLWSRADLAQRPAPEGFLSVSAETGAGLTNLLTAIAHKLRAGDTGGEANGDLRIASVRQRECLDRAADALGAVVTNASLGLSIDLIAPDLREAYEALGALIGDEADPDILGTIFSKFCVGK